MKYRRVLGIAVMVFSILGCGLPSFVGNSANPVSIDTVSVNPSIGSGTFTLHVVFTAKEEKLEGEFVHCFYVTPDGGKTIISDFVPQAYEFSRDLVFTVTQPGLYTAGCRNDGGDSKRTTTFTVKDDAMPTPTPTAPGGPLPTATAQAGPLRGRITFDYNTYQSSRPSGGGELDWVTKWCIPDVTISPEGVVSGDCTFSGTTTHMTLSTVTAHVSGTAVPGGSMQFTYEVSEKGMTGAGTEAQWLITYTGQGSFTSATQASGTADFDYSCDSGADNLLWCLSAQRETFAGTLSWYFAPSP